MAMSSSPTQNPNWETLDILSNHWSLGPGIVALASCVCKTWYSVMTREHIWKKFCFRRWPSLHHLPKPPGFSYRRFYNLRDLCRCKPTLSLDQLIFVIDIFSVSNDERLISLAVPGEDLTPIDGEEGKFNFMVDLNRKIQFPETELGVEWAVMLKGWDSVFTVMDGGSDSVVQDDFIWIEGELPGCVYPLLGLGFSPCTVKGTLIAEKVSFFFLDGDDCMNVDSSLKYLEHFLLPYKV